MSRGRRGLTEWLMTVAVALLAAAIMLRLALAIIAPLLPVLGLAVALLTVALLAVRVLVRRRDGTW